jgi:hypothetical protein
VALDRFRSAPARFKRNFKALEHHSEDHHNRALVINDEDVRGVLLL